MQWPWILLTIGVGLLLPLQSAMNAALMRALGHPFLAGATNFLVGFAAIATYAIVTRVPTAGAQLAAVPWWAWLGGFCGAAFVLTAAVSVGKIGATLMVGCIVAGNLTASLVFDHFGWLGLSVRSFTLERAIGVALLVSGVIVLARAR